MVKVVQLATLFAFLAVGGCAGENHPPKSGIAVVTVAAFGPDFSGTHSHGVGGSNDVHEGSVSSTKLSYPPMDVRSCNPSKTSCSLGIGVVDGSAKIIASTATSATVQVDLNYQVSRSYSVDMEGRRFKSEIPTDVPALHASKAVSKTLELAYGEIVHFSLPYGVDVSVCAQRRSPNGFPLDPRECQKN